MYQEIDPISISLGSKELKKLNSMLTLMRIREDAVLVSRVLVGGRPREVIVCPKEMRGDLIWSTHSLSHSGIMRTLRRLRLSWYWPGMTSDIRRSIKTCEICQAAKYGGLRNRLPQGPLWVCSTLAKSSC